MTRGAARRPLEQVLGGWFLPLCGLLWSAPSRCFVGGRGRPRRTHWLEVGRIGISPYSPNAKEKQTRVRGRQGDYFYLSFSGPSLSCLVWAVHGDPVLKTQWGLAGVAQEGGSLTILFKSMGVTFRLGRVVLMTQCPTDFS